MQLKLLFILGLLAAGSSQAQQAPALDPNGIIVRSVQHLALNPVLLRAVRNQNTEDLTPQLIAERDREWQAQDQLAGLKWMLQENTAGRFLRRVVETSGLFSEAFLTDRRGANVAAFPPTSDYYQGDEDKWRLAFEQGRIQVADIGLDASTGTEAIQVSAPLIHRGETIGVLIVAIDTKSLTAGEAR